MRSLVLLLLVALGVYWYAENRGLAVGYPPFLPVVYWKYTGEARYPVRVTGLLDAVKVKVEGELREGRLAVAFLREFSGGSSAFPPRLERTSFASASRAPRVSCATAGWPPSLPLRARVCYT